MTMFCKICGNSIQFSYKKYHLCGEECFKIYHSFYVKKYKKENKEKVSSQQKIRFLEIKNEVLGFYSYGLLCCKCCGETNIHLLSIDHINANGVIHRKKISRYGCGFYYWLKEQNYPEGYQVLCLRCNGSKFKGNFCRVHNVKLS